MKATEFRILGPELGETDGYVNATVDGIDADGTVYFIDADGSGREWSLTTDRISELTDENVMLKQSKVGSTKLWSRLSDLGSDRKNVVTKAFAGDKVAKAQKAMFLAAFEETR